MITTDITLAAGLTPPDQDQINVVDSSVPPVILAPATITWSPPAGEALPTDVVMTLSTDGNGFFFTVDPGAVTEIVTLFATWNDPAGVLPPLQAMQLNIHVTGVAAAGPVAPLQYDEVSGH